MPTTVKTSRSITAAALISSALAFGGVAFAQDMTDQDSAFEDAPIELETAETTFASYDVDGDGAFTLDEFTSYVVAKASDGDEDAKALVMSGDYATAFAEHDSDADGTLTEAEVTMKAEKSGDDWSSDTDESDTDNLEF